MFKKIHKAFFSTVFRTFNQKLFFAKESGVFVANFNRNIVKTYANKFTSQFFSKFPKNRLKKGEEICKE